MLGCCYSQWHHSMCNWACFQRLPIIVSTCIGMVRLTVRICTAFTVTKSIKLAIAPESTNAASPSSCLLGRVKAIEIFNNVPWFRWCEPLFNIWMAPPVSSCERGCHFPDSELYMLSFTQPWDSFSSQVGRFSPYAQILHSNRLPSLHLCLSSVAGNVLVIPICMGSSPSAWYCTCRHQWGEDWIARMLAVLDIQTIVNLFQAWVNNNTKLVCLV